MKPDSENIFSSAKAYEGYVGRWSRFVAQKFVAWLDVAPNESWLDVGAGTGVLTQVILQTASPAKVVGVDLSTDYVEYARQHVQDERVEFRVADAVNIAFEAPEFDAAVSGLVLNFVSAPEQAVRSMTRAVKRGGTVGAYVWDYGGRMEMMRHFWDAAAKVDPASSALDAGQRFEICKPENLRALFETVGLQSVEVTPVDVQTQFKDFDDYWLPFLGAQGSVAKYLHSASDELRTAIRDQLQKQLPTADNGTISLVARAWAVKGQTSVAL